MKRITKKLIYKAGTIYKKIAIRLSPRLFCCLFNARALMLGKDVRFLYDRDQQIFTVKSQKYKKFFLAKNQAWNSYLNGISERALSIGGAYFLDKIRFQENDLVVDCGANVGDLKLYFEENNLKIRYCGIEPAIDEYSCLDRNSLGGRTLNVGLWSENGEMSLFVASSNADSSLIKPAAKYTQVVPVHIKRLDSLLDEPIKLLKIEAEGAEPEVVMGCAKILSKIEFISADLGFERGRAEESTLVPVTNYLLQNGFDLLAISYPRIVALFKRRSPTPGPISS